MDDLNIDISDKTKDNNNFLSTLRDTFSLQNIITEKTCHEANVGTSIDIMLTNRPRSLHMISIFETRISDQHKSIISFFHSYFRRIPPKTIEYRENKTFGKSKFYMIYELLKGAIFQSNEKMYSVFTRIFQNVLNKHAPRKQKKTRGNHAPFMNRDLSNGIMNKSKTRNMYLKWLSGENFLIMKNAKNLSNNLIKTFKKSSKSFTLRLCL